MREIKSVKEFNSFINDGENGKVVKFGASWCGPCRVVESIINGMSDEEKNGVDFAEVDADNAEEELLTEWNIRNIPVLLFFKNGLVTNRAIGLLTKEELLNNINKLKNE